MLLQKTIKAKITNLTATKERLLEQEYSNYQILIHSIITNEPNCIETYSSINLYSATKQQALRFSKKHKPKPNRKHPMIIRRDKFKTEIQKTKITKFWARIPICNIRGGMWVPIHMSYKHEHLLTLSIRQAKLTKSNNAWLLHITVQKQTNIKIPHNPRILSIDLGEKYMTASVELFNNKVTNHKFYGKEARGIRRHYAWLRKRLGNRKNLGTIKMIECKERRKINEILHEISAQLVNRAAESNSVIVLGELRGIQNAAKGKRMNRVVSNMPFHKLTQYITYKASWARVAVFKVKEHRTSKTCHRCGSIGKRPSQGLFRCPSCGLQYNADLNAAINIAERFSEQCLENGVVLNPPLNRTRACKVSTFQCKPVQPTFS
jgi:putative transposase